MYGLLASLVSYLGASLSRIFPPETQGVPCVVSKETDVWINNLRERWGVQGMSVVVVTSPEYKYGNGDWQGDILSYGTADGVRAVTPKTMWSLPSTSKFITSLALAHLIDSNVTLENGELLSWDTPIEAIMTDWYRPTPEAEQNTDEDSDTRSITLFDIGKEAFTAHARDMPFHLLSNIVEKLSGVSYPEYTATHIMLPMHLEKARFGRIPEKEAEHAAAGFIRDGVDVEWCAKEVDIDKSTVPQICLGHSNNIGWWTDRYRAWNDDHDFEYAGAASLALSGTDISKILTGVLDKNIDIHRLVSLDPMYEVAQSVNKDEDTEEGFLPGIGRRYPLHFQGKLVISHGGTMGGQTSWTTWAPEEGFAIMVAMNEAFYGFDLAQTISLRITDELLHSKARNWEDLELRRNLEYASDAKRAAPIRPENEAPPVTSLEDTFFNAVLGQLELKPTSELAGDELYEFKRIRWVLKTNKSQDTFGICAHPPMYMSEIENPFLFDKIVFTPWDGDHWNWTAVNLWNFPNRLDGTQRAILETRIDQHPQVEVVGSGSAEVIEAGIKLHGTWWNRCGERVRLDGGGEFSMLGQESFLVREGRQQNA